MLLPQFYKTIGAGEESATLFIREKSVLLDQELCEKIESPMRLAIKRPRGQIKSYGNAHRKDFLVG